jgi:hypothetical protein
VGYPSPTATDLAAYAESVDADRWWATAKAASHSALTKYGDTVDDVE